jgi:hypothetical protein
MTKLKPFQEATVKVVLEAFRQKDGSRRFLVADEVGLGKTVVAQEVIRQLIKRKQRPLVVFYVCSSLSIASQNKAKLLEILPEAERNQATCPVDRLTLMPAARRPSHPRLHLYTLTPGTSIPIQPGIRRDGKQEERALIHALVEEIWPKFLTERGENFFQRSAKRWWHDWVKIQRRKVKGSPRLCTAYRKSVRTEFNLEKGQRLVPVLRDNKSALDLIAHFRNALAASALDELRPDLVIFDEFQRFRNLLNPEKDRAAARVIGKLRGEGLARPPALLLLSATPYRLYSRRWEDAQGNSHHAEFFDLIEFLYGRGDLARQRRAECEASLTELEKELRRGYPDSQAAQTARDQVELILRPIIARTERASCLSRDADNRLVPLRAEIEPDDLKIYCHLSQSFSDHHRSSAVYFWTSIPLPMQTMGNTYITWRQANPVSAQAIFVLSENDRNQFGNPEHWPHPRLRALKEELAPPRQLALPWMAPSLSWWPLDGAWKMTEGKHGKLLIFSRFRAVPQAVAALLSYDLEAFLMAEQKLKYAAVTERKALQATKKRPNLLALFNPWPWLIESTDPLVIRNQSLEEVRERMQGQIRKALNQLGIRIIRRTSKIKRKYPVWQLLGQIEAQAGRWPWIRNAWWTLHQDIQRKKKRKEDPDAGLGRLLRRWESESLKPLEYVTPQEVEELAEYALSAPGVVLGRALSRHWPEAVTRQGYLATLEVVWSGLRNYLDQRWFFVALRGESEDNFPTAIRQAVIDGNLEAVLDEHLWIISQLRNLSGPALAKELGESLSLRSSPFYLHPADDISDKGTFSLRCHAALSFIETQARTRTDVRDDGPQQRPFRPDELRKSFNSPFWPHVLVTTSVGQEGLDFHVWCKSLVHWDLCSNPVDLEQREGRIQRYGGLATRQAIADRLGGEAMQCLKRGESPWHRLGQLAEARLGDETGLAPWWICDGAEINRYIFDVPLSEQAYRLKWVQEQRLLYRLVLGQPNQEDLLEVLARQNDLPEDEIRRAMLQLSPWFDIAS